MTAQSAKIKTMLAQTRDEKLLIYIKEAIKPETNPDQDRLNNLERIGLDKNRNCDAERPEYDGQKIMAAQKINREARKLLSTPRTLKRR